MSRGDRMAKKNTHAVFLIIAHAEDQNSMSCKAPSHLFCYFTNKLHVLCSCLPFFPLKCYISNIQQFYLFYLIRILDLGLWHCRINMIGCNTRQYDLI